ncbi:MAG: hypothetical protein GY851_30885 [bacterium]|nr:hypothetical protein [bacterium]
MRFQLLSVVLALIIGAAGAQAPFPGDPVQGDACATYTFPVDGVTVHVLAPDTAAEGRPWVLRGPGDPSATDRALIAMGYHIVAPDVPDRFGSPAAVAVWDAVFSAMTDTYGLAGKVAVEGHGLDALLAHTWAAAHPDQTACIYSEWPVLDFRSWPGGKGKADRDEALWADVLEAYGFSSDDEAMEYALTPVDNAEPLGKADVPYLHIANRKDPKIPFDEHVAEYWRQYDKHGGRQLHVITHPEHRVLETPTPAVFLIARYTAGGSDELVSADEKTLETWKITPFAGTEGVFKLGDVIYLEQGNDMTGVNWTGTFPRMNYEIALDAMRVDGDDFFCGLTFPVGEDPCTLVVGGWAGTVVGLSCLDYADAYNNETCRVVEFEKAKWYRIRLRVEPERIQAWIDGKQIVDVGIKDRIINVRSEVELSRPLGISTWRTTGAFRDFAILPIIN